MSTTLQMVLLVYWVTTTIYGTYYLAKLYLKRNGDLTLDDVVGNMIISAFFFWMLWPMTIWHIKVLKKKK